MSQINLEEVDSDAENYIISCVSEVISSFTLYKSLTIEENANSISNKRVMI